MFDSALAKLTSVYVGILLIICLFFSINWYIIAERELERAPQRLDQILQSNSRSLRPSIVQDILEIRNNQLARSKQAIILRIALSNAAIVMLGMLGSYWLAKRTLRPIERAHEAQGRFTADASHELRTPLAAMRTETEVTLRDTKLNKQMAVEQLRSNLDEIKQLQELTDSLLLLSQDASDEPVNLKSTQLDEVITGVLERFTKVAKEHKLVVRKQLKAKQAYTNAELLSAIVGILVDNAIKYSSTKGTITVSSSYLDKNTVVVSVQDQGIGMSPDVQAHIFERFYRADTSRSKHEVQGHGLGLSIAYELSKRLAAHIQVSSQPNKGSIFSIYLPRQS